MEIRYLIDSDDRNKLSRIYEESWKYAYRGLIPQEYLDSIPEGRWIKIFDIPGWNTMVCVENGEYIGTSSFCKSRFAEYPDAAEIISIYFLPEFMGKGNGRLLLTAVLDELKKLGFTEVFLWILEGNERAMRFYNAFGFKRTEDYLDDNIGGKNVREVRFVYPLR